VIRKARSADVAALTELDRVCFPAADRFPRRTWRHLLTTAARNRSCISIIAECDGTVVGAAAVLLRSDSTLARLYTLAVDPSARGGGLGRRLIAEILQRVPARCDRVSLEVRATNTAARGLYESLGLEKSADLPAYYADYADAVRMRGPLKQVVHTALSSIARA
jgi:ribosomal protein S18 acetylase RimI-like enzyme